MQVRGYVAKEGRALHAKSLGRVLAAFLENYFQKYVDYSFTSSVEDLLDGVSGAPLLLPNHKAFVGTSTTSAALQSSSSTERAVCSLAVINLFAVAWRESFLPPRGHALHSVQGCSALQPESSSGGPCSGVSGTRLLSSWTRLPALPSGRSLTSLMLGWGPTCSRCRSSHAQIQQP